MTSPATDPDDAPVDRRWFEEALRSQGFVVEPPADDTEADTSATDTGGPAADPQAPTADHSVERPPMPSALLARIAARGQPGTIATPEPGTQIYACGPVRMLSALEAHCAAWPEDALHVEHFESTLRTLDPSREHAFDVELKDSGIVVHVPADQTVLSALRAANIDVQSDCEEGLCGSCEVRVLAGKVDHRDVIKSFRNRRESRIAFRQDIDGCTLTTQR